MRAYPFNVPSGVNITPEASGQSSIGSASLPFASLTATAANFTTASYSSDITLSSGSDILNSVSNINNLGNNVYPFASVYANEINGATVVKKFLNDILSTGTNGTDTVFYTLFSPYLGEVELYKSGIHMMTGTSFDFIVNSGNALVFNTAPATGSTLLATYPYLS